MVAVNEDLLVEGPFFTQVNASTVKIYPTGAAAGTVVTLGAVAAATGSQTRNANGLPTAGLPLNLAEVRTVAGVPVTAAAQANIVGITFTPGTSEFILSEAANNNTKTDVGCWEYVLPASYVAGQNITVTANSKATLNSGTAGTQTIAFNAFRVPGDGTTGANLIATAAQNITTSNANTTFTITGTTLNPLDRIIIKMTLTNQETAAGGGIVQQVNSIKLS